MTWMWCIPLGLIRHTMNTLKLFACCSNSSLLNFVRWWRWRSAACTVWGMCYIVICYVWRQSAIVFDVSHRFGFNISAIPQKAKWISDRSETRIFASTHTPRKPNSFECTFREIFTRKKCASVCVCARITKRFRVCDNKRNCFRKTRDGVCAKESTKAELCAVMQNDKVFFLVVFRFTLHFIRVIAQRAYTFTLFYSTLMHTKDRHPLYVDLERYVTSAVVWTTESRESTMSGSYYV